MRRRGVALMATVLGLAMLTSATPAYAASHPAPVAGERYTAQLIDAVPGDPSFRFGFEFSIGDVTPREAMAAVRDCLSCVFPLGGAPAVFPEEGQVVPFTLPVFTDADDFTSKVTTWDASLPATPGFQLVADGENFAGPGSVVAFGFFTDRGGNHMLSVDGLVMNDLGASETAYRSAISAVGAGLAANIADGC